MNFNILEQSVKELHKQEKAINQLSKLTKISEPEFTSIIMDAAKNETAPDSEEGKKILKLGSLIRSFGQKVLNLFSITITCSFSGVTLFTWTLPKLQDNQVLDNNSKKSNKNTNKQ